MHNPCGLDVISGSEMIVSQMQELTRVVDVDGDGVADRYETISDDWGVSGNYHETNTITPDGEGGNEIFFLWVFTDFLLEISGLSTAVSCNNAVDANKNNIVCKLPPIYSLTSCKRAFVISDLSPLMALNHSLQTAVI
jgi:hypothetical protein